MKYSQDAYRTTVDIGTDVKNGIAKRHMGWPDGSVTTGITAILRFQFGYNGSENFADGHRSAFSLLFSAWNIAEENLSRNI